MRIGQKFQRCKCGCEEWIIYKKYHKFYTPKYISGHNRRKKKVENRIEKRTDEIIRLYNKNIPIYKIGELMDCSFHYIKRTLKKNNIKLIRKPNSGQIKKNNELALKNFDEIKIMKLYDEGGSMTEIGKAFNCSTCPIKRILLKNNIEIRPQKHYIKGKYALEKNPFWKGGVSFEPYGIEFNRELKNEIRKRDNFTCQECGITEEELKKQENNRTKKLRIHHIDYNKQNNSTFNLISLCVTCHNHTNHFNRKHWTDYFKMKIFLKEFFNPQNIKVFNENRQLIAREFQK